MHTDFKPAPLTLPANVEAHRRDLNNCLAVEKNGAAAGDMVRKVIVKRLKAECEPTRPLEILQDGSHKGK